MNHVDLFSGIGGFALAASWCWGDEYVNLGHSEIEKFPCQVYHKHFPESECLGDITKIEWERFRGKIDLVTGGFPCQPHSVAGKRRASADKRDLWVECVRALCYIRPRYALFENVPGLLTSERGWFFNQLLADMAAIGYDAEWKTISAADVGARHLRKRIWIVAQDSERIRCNGTERKEASEVRGFGKSRAGNIFGLCEQSLADSRRNGLALIRQQGQGETTRPEELQAYDGWKLWATEPNVDRVANGIPDRVDRNRALGNAIVPQVAYEIFKAIKAADEIIHPPLSCIAPLMNKEKEP